MPLPDDPQYMRFFNCLAYVTENQLRELCLRSMKDYIDYLTDVGVSRDADTSLRFTFNNSNIYACETISAVEWIKYILILKIVHQLRLQYKRRGERSVHDHFRAVVQSVRGHAFDVTEFSLRRRDHVSARGSKTGMGVT